MVKAKKTPFIWGNVHHPFCAGCGHGIVTRLIAEVLEELDQTENFIFTLGVGCSCNIHHFFKGDKLQCAHGRAAAMATGMKRVSPDTIIMTYQGDGDASAIGIAETLNAAYRNEKITAFVINNALFGMTGGQMSWTTLPGMKTKTSVTGRDCSVTGEPMKLVELISSQFKVAYAARGSVHTAKDINKTKKYIKNALEAQLAGEGYSIVEFLSPCPTNLGIPPFDSLEWVKNKMLPYFPTGEFTPRRGTEK